MQNVNDYNNSIFDNKKDCISYNLDVFEFLENKIPADLIYLDPPYAGTMNDYFGFYGLLDSYIKGKDIKQFENKFTSKSSIIEMLDTLIEKSSRYKYCMLSYNNSAYPSSDIILDIMKRYYSSVEIFEKEHTYKVTGIENKNKNKELLFLGKN